MVSKKRPDRVVGHGDHTLEEIGDAFGVSREAIRQIQDNAFRKIRRELFKRGIKASDFFDVKPK